MWMGVRGELDRVQLRRQALNYAGHGWDVMPGAYLTGDRFSCGPGCRTDRPAHRSTCARPARR